MRLLPVGKVIPSDLPTPAGDAAPKASEKVAACYFIVCGGQRTGPLTPRQLVDVGLTARSFIWREGLTAWTRAAEVPELVRLVGKLPPPPPPESTNLIPASPANTSPGYGKRAAGAIGEVIGSFRKLDFKAEVWPLDAGTLRAVAAKPTFWLVSLLAVLPLAFCTLKDGSQMLLAFALFFAGLWGLIFCQLIEGEEVAWRWRIGALFFTGIIGLWVLGHPVYGVFPNAVFAMTSSETGLVKWLGYLFPTGYCEELTKAVPVLIILAIRRNRLNHADVVLLGIFSGLGFAAFENMSYFRGQLDDSLQRAIDLHTAAASGDSSRIEVAGQQFTNSELLTMLLPLLRLLASSFAHAIWGGIFAHFIDRIRRPEAAGRRAALFLTGWTLTALLHGTYDWCFGVQSLLPAVVVVLSFALLNLYMSGETASVPVQPVTDTPQPWATEPAVAEVSHG